VIVTVSDFSSWRDAVRALIAASVAPADVTFRDLCEGPGLFSDAPLPESNGRQFAVDREFLTAAEIASYHRRTDKWQLMYRILWRLIHGERRLMRIESDPEVRELCHLGQHVRRDAHKMKAFVRFRRVVHNDEEHFIAWHRPDHRVVRLTAPFFARRFPKMNWTILTPDESVHWDRHELRFGPGVPASAAPEVDALEDLWRAYYRATFNPARIKLAMMRREMPVRYWPTLPETSIIGDLLHEAPRRVAEMIDRTKGCGSTATPFVPPNASWEELPSAVTQCQGCDLYRNASQVVFGEGPSDARIVLVGEQPGDEEDRAGRPFVGPAGQILNEVLQEAGIDRGKVYLTNAVKHFKHESRGKMRLHRRPTASEIIACRPWLVAELIHIQPRVLVCLGVTAAQSVFGHGFRMHKMRSEVLESPWCAQTIATYHPASVLRVSNELAEQYRRALVRDLRLARSLAG
jgi:DNA polymerase